MQYKIDDPAILHMKGINWFINQGKKKMSFVVFPGFKEAVNLKDVMLT